MRVNPLLIPVLLITALLGTVFTAQALGQWSISGRTSVNLQQLTPADLKGWMTLQQVMDSLSISQAELYTLSHIPADIPPSTALKDLEPLVPDFEVSTLQDKLAAWQTGVPAEPTPAPTPAPIATTAHVGDGTGTGPTPLPPGQILPAHEIKGRLTLRQVSEQCAVPLEALIAALQLPANTNVEVAIKDLIAQGALNEVTQVQTVVAGLQGN